MVNLPSKSVKVALLVPFSDTATPGSASPEPASLTTPETDCAMAKFVARTKANTDHSENLFFIVPVFLLNVC